MNGHIILLAIFFALIENNYFGWNFRPSSDAEIICDGLVFILFALSVKDK